MQAFDLEIGQQFCRVDAASQSIENSLPIAGTSAAAKWAPLGRSCHGGGPPHPAVPLPAAWQPSWRFAPGGLVCLWGITQGSKPSERFGMAEGLCWAWGGRKGQPSRGVSHHQESWYLWEQTGRVRSAMDVFRNESDKTQCNAEGLNCSEVQKKAQGCLSCEELFLAMQFFAEELKRKTHVLWKRFTYVSCKMVTVIPNYLWGHLTFLSRVFKMPKLRYCCY